MNAKLFKSFVVAAALTLISVGANATVISRFGYTHDDTTDLVVGGGLEWLQWDRTAGLSIQDATNILDTIEGGGWSIASNVQMSGLFNSYFPAVMPGQAPTDDTYLVTYTGANVGTDWAWDQDEDTWQHARTGVTVGYDGPDEADVKFINMFGNMFTNSNFKYIEAIFGHDLDGDGMYNSAWVQDDFYGNHSGSWQEGIVAMYGNAHWVGAGFSLAGVALVREAFLVPEPSIIALFGLGLVGLGFARRRRQS